MKVYYARPISLYNTKQETRDLELIEKMGFEPVNPNKEELQERYKQEGMSVFMAAVSDCDGVAFRAFQDGKIGAGVKMEVDKAIELGKFVIELPTINISRILSVEETREYLTYLGNR